MNVTIGNRPVTDYIYPVLYKLYFRPKRLDRTVITAHSNTIDFQRIFWKFYWRVS